MTLTVQINNNNVCPAHPRHVQAMLVTSTFPSREILIGLSAMYVDEFGDHKESWEIKGGVSNQEIIGGGIIWQNWHSPSLAQGLKHPTQRLLYICHD